MNNVKKSYALNWLLIILVSLVGWFCKGVDDRLGQLDQRLRQVELKQCLILTRLGVDTDSIMKPAAAAEQPFLHSLSTRSTP